MPGVWARGCRRADAALGATVGAGGTSRAKRTGGQQQQQQHVGGDDVTTVSKKRERERVLAHTPN